MKHFSKTYTIRPNNAHQLGDEPGLKTTWRLGYAAVAELLQKPFG